MVAATQAASATEEYTREDFTAVTLQPLIAPLGRGTAGHRADSQDPALTGNPPYSIRPYRRARDERRDRP
jgi:hypothetical protein